MGATVGIMNGFSTAAGAYTSASAAKMQGDYQGNQAKINADLAEAQARDADLRGSSAAAQQIKKTQMIAGNARAAAASSGVNADQGSAAAIISETNTMGAMDALTIKNNATREAYGYRVQAMNYNSEGEFARIAGNNTATNTLLTGGMRAISGGLDTYSKYKNDKTGTTPGGTRSGNGRYGVDSNFDAGKIS